MSGGGGVPSVSVPTVRSGPVSHQTTPEPLEGSLRVFSPYQGSDNGERPGSSAGLRIRAPNVRAMIDVVKSATWWSPKATCMSTVCLGVPGSGFEVMCRA